MEVWIVQFDDDTNIYENHEYALIEANKKIMLYINRYWDIHDLDEDMSQCKIDFYSSINSHDYVNSIKIYNQYINYFGGVYADSSIETCNVFCRTVYTSESNSAKSVCNTTHPVINNHICPSCHNDKCSKNEKSCWKCGSKL